MEIRKKYKVIIIGAGPSGVGAAIALSERGIKPVLIIDREDKIGGIPKFYKRKKNGLKTFIRWTRGGFPVFGSDFATWLEKKLSETNTEIKLNSQVLEIDPKKKLVSCISPDDKKMTITSDAIIMACGAREKNQAERGWVAGSRPSKVFFTKHILYLIDIHELLPFKKPVILGSDLIAYAMAAKLKKAGTADSIIIDSTTHPKCSFFERLYFKLWGNPIYHSTHFMPLKIVGGKTVTGVEFNGKVIPCDGVVICGELVPCSELALLGGLKIDVGSRKPVVSDECMLSEPGWFVAGNMLGGFHGAEWCFFNGKRVSKQVIKYLTHTNGI